MIKANDITKALYMAFDTDPDFSQYTIERGELVNMDPKCCPWLGIYRGEIDYSPETLGDGPDYWTGILKAKLIVQAVNFQSGAATEDDLEDQVEKIITKVFDDTTIRSTVDMVNEVKVSYSYVADDEETFFFQAAMIDLTMEVSTS